MPHEPPYDLTGLVLAGGESRRMGQPKALMCLCGQSLAQRAISALSPFCQEVILVTRHPVDFLDLKTRIVGDLVPGQGPLGGLVTGLFYARCPWVLAVACDLPFLSPQLLGFLAARTQELASGPKAIVPLTKDGWHPLVAAYSRSCLRPAQALLANNRRKVYELKSTGVKWLAVEEAQLKSLDPELISFINLNTPEDFQQAEERLLSPEG